MATSDLERMFDDWAIAWSSGHLTILNLLLPFLPMTVFSRTLPSPRSRAAIRSRSTFTHRGPAARAHEDRCLQGTARRVDGGCPRVGSWAAFNAPRMRNLARRLRTDDQMQGVWQL